MDAHLSPASSAFDRELSDLCYDVLALGSLPAARAHILERLAKWFSLDQAIWVQEPRHLEMPAPGSAGFLGLLRPVKAALGEPMMAFRHLNPLLQTMVKQREAGVIQVGDVQPRRQWKRNPFQCEVCAPMGLREMMAVEITEGEASRGTIFASVVGRDRGTFSKGEVQRFDRLSWAVRPLVTHLRHQAERTAILRVDQPPTTLTTREKEVFYWMGQGKRNKEIALIIKCAPRTVEKHVEAILKKTHTENRIAAARSQARD